MQETWIWSLGWEDPLEKRMAIYSSILARKIPWIEEPGSPWGRQESDMTERLPFHFSLSCIGERNGNPLQCSCLRILGMGEPGGLPSMGSHRVGHDWSDLAAAYSIICLSSSYLSVIYHLKLKGLIILSGGEDLEDLEPPYTAGGDVKCCGRFGKHFGCILKG